MSEPPSSRPTAPPAPAIAPNTPNAVLRSFGSVKVVVSSDSAEGTRIAANAPWQARAVISMVKLTEAPPMAETPAKPVSPVRNVTLRPSRSDSLPPSSSKLPNDSVYAVSTHCRSTVEKCSACCADGNAIFITVRSSTTISCARPITQSSSQRRRSRPPPATVASAMTITLRSLANTPYWTPRRRLTPRSPLQSCDQAGQRSSPDPGDSPPRPSGGRAGRRAPIAPRSAIAHPLTSGVAAIPSRPALS